MTRKRHFSELGRVVDILTMAILYNTFLDIDQIAEDYEIKKRTAQDTIDKLKRIEFIDFYYNKRTGKHEIKLKQEIFNSHFMQ